MKSAQALTFGYQGLLIPVRRMATCKSATAPALISALENLGGSFEERGHFPFFVGKIAIAVVGGPLSLSYDHRVIDGADAIRFLRFVVDAIEQPFTLALRG